MIRLAVAVVVVLAVAALFAAVAGLPLIGASVYVFHCIFR